MEWINSNQVHADWRAAQIRKIYEFEYQYNRYSLLRNYMDKFLPRSSRRKFIVTTGAAVGTLALKGFASSSTTAQTQPASAPINSNDSKALYEAAKKEGKLV